MAYINKLGSEFQLFCTQTSGVSSISLLGSCREWIEAQGTLLTVSIDGSPIFSVTDAAISSRTLVLLLAGRAEKQAVQVTVSLADRLGAMEIDRMALGQGGLSAEPMWDSRIAEIRALRPTTLVRQQLGRNPKLLANKKVVVWEFVERDIRFGTEGWQIVTLTGIRSQSRGN